MSKKLRPMLTDYIEGDWREATGSGETHEIPFETDFSFIEGEWREAEPLEEEDLFAELMPTTHQPLSANKQLPATRPRGEMVTTSPDWIEGEWREDYHGYEQPSKDEKDEPMFASYRPVHDWHDDVRNTVGFFSDISGINKDFEAWNDTFDKWFK